MGGQFFEAPTFGVPGDGLGKLCIGYLDEGAMSIAITLSLRKHHLAALQYSNKCSAYNILYDYLQAMSLVIEHLYFDVLRYLGIRY